MHDSFPAQMLREAKENPDGWVYEIDPKFDPYGHVPVHGIIRAWKISASGDPTGEVWENPDYRQGASPG